MAPSVFFAVLLGAALHASWNAIVKGAPDKMMTTVLIAAVSGAAAGVALPFLPLPDPASWPFLAASALVQILYFGLVAAAYRAADLSLAYPLMRGSAPVLVALAGAALLGEHLTAAAWAGVGLVTGGVLGMALAGSRAPASRRGVALALVNAAVIAAYTLLDGLGVRRSGAPVAYAMWLFLLNAVPLLLWALAARRARLTAHARRYGAAALVGGFGNLGSYGLALWAMTGAPVAAVAALRETSILFGLAIAALALGERPGPAHLAAAALIALGAVSLRLG
jgi:drug/metabolite transporter (DMT)-like permease